MRLRLAICLFLTMFAFNGIAQTQQCIHGPNETPQEKQRRNAGVTFLRVLNTLEYNYRTPNKRFGSYNELLTLRPALQVPAGFELRLTTDEIRYNISLVDQTDPDKWSLFTTDAGIIYDAHPTQ